MESYFRIKICKWLVTEFTQINADSVQHFLHLHNYKVVI